MPRFVALLRGVNVGKGKRVPMADLHALLMGLGYTHVATLLNSGNAVFHATDGAAARHAKEISAAIAAQLKVEVPVVVKSVKELSSIIAGNPIDAKPEDYNRLLVAFVQDAKSMAVIKVIGARVIAPERFVLGRNAAYLFCARGILESKAAVALLGKPGRVATSRNLATVLKLEALAKADSQNPSS